MVDLRSFFRKSRNIFFAILSLFKLDRSAIKGSFLFVIVLFCVLIVKLVYFNSVSNRVKSLKIENLA